MKRPAIAVTGLGMITPVGHTTDTTWDGVRACVARPHRLRTAGLRRRLRLYGLGIDLDEAVGGRSAFRMGRYVKFALLAAREAVADAGLDPRAGTAPGSPSWSGPAAEDLSAGSDRQAWRVRPSHRASPAWTLQPPAHPDRGSRKPVAGPPGPVRRHRATPERITPIG
ncbi:hypothetical protein SBADM41S_11654 [Streptomyces badius]